MLARMELETGSMGVLEARSWMLGVGCWISDIEFWMRDAQIKLLPRKQEVGARSRQVCSNEKL
jgi:hypothetical protein